MAYMDQSFREFLTQREAVLRQREEELRSQIEELGEQLSIVASEIKEIFLALHFVEEGVHRDIKPSNIIRLTIKEAVIKVLKRYSRPMTALEILDKLSTDHEMRYERTSLSPQLSRLKADGKIRLEKGLWSLPD